MPRITYESKINTGKTPATATERQKLISAEDINQIKSVVNDNYDELVSVSSRTSNVATKLESVFQDVAALKVKPTTRSVSTTFRYVASTSSTITAPSFNLDNTNLQSKYIPYPTNYTLAAGENVDYWILSIRLSNNSSYNSWSRNFTTRFIVEPFKTSSSSGLSDIMETYNQTIVATFNNKDYVVDIMLNQESSGMFIAHHTRDNYNNNLYNDNISFEYQWSTKIRKTILN